MSWILIVVERLLCIDGLVRLAHTSFAYTTCLRIVLRRYVIKTHERFAVLSLCDVSVSGHSGCVFPRLAPVCTASPVPPSNPMCAATMTMFVTICRQLSAATPSRLPPDSRIPPSLEATVSPPAAAVAPSKFRLSNRMHSSQRRPKSGRLASAWR